MKKLILVNILDTRFIFLRKVLILENPFVESGGIVTF